MSEDDPSQWVAVYVECNDCGAKGRHSYPIGWVESEQAAAEAWNDREPSRLHHVGYVTEYLGRELKRGTSGTMTLSPSKTFYRHVPVYIGPAEPPRDD